MKIEDAIARINEIKIEIDNWRDSLGEKLSERDVIDIQAYDIALQALEKQIPKEPCRYCSVPGDYLGASPYGDTMLFVDVTGSLLRIFDEEHPGFTDTYHISYCPMCGRKLD